MRDFLTSAPLHIGDLLRSSYEFQMKYVAWSYDLTYRLLYRLPALCPPVGKFMTRLTAPNLMRWAEEYQADVIVSTYPLTSIVLGELRRRGRVDKPAINFITDFGVHPFWIHPGIDLNLAVHPRPAGLAEAKSGRPSIATGPMVSPRFAQPQDRAAARRQLGLSDDDRAVLIVSGSWGVGPVAGTFRTIASNRGASNGGASPAGASHGRFVPIVVCGRDERLRERLSRIPGGRVLGWTDDMPGLMAASDALVENAGGLTAMEALSVGLPIISYRPIAGHGKENTAEMQASGVSRVARNAADLLRLLDFATTPGAARQAMIDAGKAMFHADPARYVELAAIVGPAGLNDRQLLATVDADLDGDLLVGAADGVADGVEFDPTQELRELLAASSSDSDPADDGPLAPIVPIGHRRGDDMAIAPAGPASRDSADFIDLRPADELAADTAEDSVEDFEDSVEDDELEPTGTSSETVTRRRKPRRPSVALARMAALVAAVPLIWAGMTSGVAFATSYGAGVAHPASHPANVAYIGVRLGESELNDPAIIHQLVALHASAVIDEMTAASDPADVQHLVSLGIDVENGGEGPRLDRQGHHIDESPWTRADGDVAASQLLSRIAGQPVRVFVPGRRLNVFDLVACHDAHNTTVVPNQILEPADDDPLHLTPRHTYLVNGSNATDQQMQVMLSQLSTQLNTANLSGAPLSDLV